MDNQQALIKKSSINYGLILGGILAISSAIMYAVNVELFTKWWLGIIFFLIALFTGIVSVAKSKSLLGGFMSFKQAFTAYFITIAIGLFIGVVVSILIFAFLDPGAADYLNEQAMIMQESILKRFGTPEAEIERQMAAMEGKNNYSLGNQLLGYVFQLAFYSLFGLLVALIMKRKDPNAIN
ncbi:MAG: DUF4199 domain-containing protein [Bacteroidota bacterium]